MRHVFLEWRSVLAFLARRVAHSVLLLVAAAQLAFVLSEWAPGDVLSPARIGASQSRRALQAERRDLGLDRPLLQRWWAWSRAAVGGDLGRSALHGTPVLPLVLARAERTLLVAVPSALLGWLLGVALAMSAAAWSERASRRLTLLLGGVNSLPVVVVSILLLVVLASGAVRAGEFPRVSVAMAVAGVLLLQIVPRVAVQSLRALLEQSRAPFALAARAAGIPERRLIVRHLLPAAAGTVAPLLAVSFTVALGAGIVAELVLGWPGLGPLAVEALLGRDTPLVVGLVLVQVAFVAVAHLVADAVHLVADPRVAR